MNCVVVGHLCRVWRIDNRIFVADFEICCVLTVPDFVTAASTLLDSSSDFFVAAQGCLSSFVFFCRVQDCGIELLGRRFSVSAWVRQGKSRGDDEPVPLLRIVAC